MATEKLPLGLQLRGKALREAERIATAELVSLTPITTIGQRQPIESVATETGALHTLRFTCLKESYPGWFWTVVFTQLDEKAPLTIAEVGLLPGADALLAPEWVPWSKRLAEYREQQAAAAIEEAVAAAEAHQELDEDDVDPEDDLLENDFTDFDDEINGVEIDDADLDELDEDDID